MGRADVEFVFIEIPIVGLKDTLQIGRDMGSFSLRLREEDIGVSVEALAGHDVNFMVQDQAGEETAVIGQRISRIIEETPVANDPTGLITAPENPPMLSWTDVRVNYSFKYQVDITRVDQSIPTLVQTIRDIPSDSLSARAISMLPAGQYFWTVSIIDEFGKQSRSREAGFIIP